ncbi:regulation of nuclear pre-mRNA domain-containing protein 2 [Phalaenopsis equestris]|uniref:regulation of nuclear pre-mRNA domain-containing protein 2 n=1 Tax=Phalaenopsis equestris TaxID=78828 RepID=UPI0009E56BF2|nr:regulation of nuclear pre-mRNA domain-containing protein 2 [Phalaenopsis equestris]XP_020591001.1 regulation of nuclear pre-mRNA domain-containing protein 2 [Phalaenopsis equestris]
MNGNGNGTFNSQILVDKLAKLNSSQQSIETLSHWCIFHRTKARQVVEIWDRQFHHSPREQRLSFLYLANDILQNSRRKGVEFVNEFWKVLPDALNDLIEKGDDFGRKAALRLVDIWEDRKVFGSRGRVLKEEILGRNSENIKSSERNTNYKLKYPGGELLQKIISGYELIHNENIDEDALFGRCSTAVSSLEKMDQEIGKDVSLGSIGGSGAIEELKGWHNILRDCVGQLKVAESSRITLQSHLREALHEQELKIEQVHDQLQVVLSRYEQSSNILLQLQSMNNSNTSQPLPEEKPDEPSVPISDTSAAFPAETSAISSDYKHESAPVRYTQQQPAPIPCDNSLQNDDEQRKKTAAAEVAAKLTASTSSAQMLSYVLSSLASESIIGNQSKNEDYSPHTKRPKVENGVPPLYLPTTPPSSQPPPPPFPHPDSINPPPPPSSPPAIPPLMPPLMPPANISPFIQANGPMAGVLPPYNYGSSPLQIPPSLTPHLAVNMPLYSVPANPYHGFQMSDGGGSFGLRRHRRRHSRGNEKFRRL